MIRNRSIKFKITMWFTLGVTIILSLAILVAIMASRSVLRTTIRNYLISTVDNNYDMIEYIPANDGSLTDQEKIDKRTENHEILIDYSGGYLLIDEDFMNIVNDVNTALYTADGTMLYGENPLARRTENIPFTESHIWNMAANNVNYVLYDRKLNLDLPDDETLWMRGIVPETESEKQLRDISGLVILIVPVIAVLSIMLGYFLSRRMLAPISDMEKTASSISQGDDLSRRIDIGNGNDELHKLADDFNMMFERLEESFGRERQFTSDASHELRTPMSVIMAQCEYTLESGGDISDYIESLETIHRQSLRMNGLINDMLDYTRMDQGAEEKYPKYDFDLSVLTERISDSMAMLRTNDITLTSDIEPGLHINGNERLVDRLISNLISNAYRYGKEGGTIKVKLSSCDADDTGRPHVRLDVIDDGIGIDEGDLEKIFDRFYRKDSARTEQGTGLGLAMVKKIAEIHEAEIFVDSAPGKGSTFTVIFERM